MKASKVVFIDDSLEKSFNDLPEKDHIKKGLRRAVQNIEQEIFCGRNVKEKLNPKKIV